MLRYHWSRQTDQNPYETLDGGVLFSKHASIWFILSFFFYVFRNLIWFTGPHELPRSLVRLSEHSWKKPYQIVSLSLSLWFFFFSKTDRSEAQHPHFISYATKLASMLKHTVIVDQVWVQAMTLQCWNWVVLSSIRSSILTKKNKK